MTTPQDPYSNPPGWTDPYADLTNISGDDPLPPMEPPTTPPAPPPGSPLLTGLIIGLLLISLSVAVFQLLRGDDDITAAGTTTTTAEGTETTTTDGTGTTTTDGTGTTTSVPATDPYPPVEPPIPVEDLKLITDGMRVNDNDIPDIVFGTDAETAIGRFTASFGEATNDTGWQVSTGGSGVCVDDPERIVTFGTYAAIVTKPGGQEVYNGYRQDLTFADDITHPSASLETLSGLRVGDTVETLQAIYSGQNVSFSVDPKLGDVYLVESSSSGKLLLWGPVGGDQPDDIVVGIYAPDICNRP